MHKHTQNNTLQRESYQKLVGSMWPSDILQMSLGQLLNVSVYKVYEYKSTAALNLKIHSTGKKIKNNNNKSA